MQIELLQIGYNAALEEPIKVKYKGTRAGDYAADILVDNKVLVELKVAKQYNKMDKPQLLNTLKATAYKVG